MEEIVSMIFNGVNLVKELELRLSLQESPESLSNSIGSISTLFDDANKRLKILVAMKNSLVPNQPEPEQVPMSVLDQMMMQIEPGLMEDCWVRHTMMQTMMSTDSVTDSAFSTARPRRRKKDGEEETVLVAAAAGKMEIPPDDNYTWRKYGQKDILGSKFPRAYYRCIHQKKYECPAKKQVQRLDEDPCTFRITYLSLHTCHFFTNVRAAAAETMFGNINSVVPLSQEPYFNHRYLVPGDDGDGDTWNSPSLRHDMS